MIKPLYNIMRHADGTLRVHHPLVGEEVWCVPGRAQRPITNERRAERRKLAPGFDPRESCHFCPGQTLHTPAEKSRVTRLGPGWKVSEKLSAEECAAASAVFRRVPNLFEIIPFDYWRKNYGLQLTARQRQWMDRYRSTPMGSAHLLAVVAEKLAAYGRSPEEIDATPDADKLKMAEAFFGGSHDLVVAGGHLKPGAEFDDELLGSGDLEEDEHFLFMSFTLHAAMEIQRENPFVRYVSVYQNWLAQAGASFDHLHKQVLGIDTWGTGLARRLELLRKDPDLYNDVIIATLKRERLLLIESERALAVVEPGYSYPAVVVYSKSKQSDPHLLHEADLRELSRLLRLAHLASGTRLPLNEEWHYRPRASQQGMPFHVAIKWRINTPAGLEGGSQIHVNPLFPEIQRQRLLESLRALPAAELDGLRLGDDCPGEPLLYSRP